MKFKSLSKCFAVSILILFNKFHLLAQDNPRANPATVITTENVRFTVLTHGLVRLEWDSLGVFEDNATQVIQNRYLNKPEFTVIDTKKNLTIITKKFKLIYKKSKERLSSKNLSIEAIKDIDKEFKWNLAVENTGNLLGTAKTLDNYNGAFLDVDHTKKLEMENGLLSTNGWFLMDDSKSYLLDDDDIPWVKDRRFGHSQDFYFFCYGSDYKTAIYDYTLIAGKIPLPPRFAFGYWWSRYYAYSDHDLRAMISDFEKNKIPLDVLVIDMDWHPTKGAYEKDPRRDLSGSRRGWTGYTWDKRLFPEPEKFLKWTADKNLKLTLNLHPASGIPFTEEKYPVFANAMGFDTTGLTSRKLEANNEFAKWPVFDQVSYKDILFDGSSKKYVNSLFDLVLQPLQKQGVDFWWLDWQQYKYDKVFKQLDNVWWLNHVFFLKMQQQKTARPLIYHRWGGLGNHRYQIGFSGDATITWKTLAFEPYFTSTASNVLYGYWSHDIGGHLATRDTTEVKNQALDPELYTRWLQYGVFSPILRTHSTTGIKMSRLPWEFSSKYEQVLNQYIHLRYALAPYIYTMARKAYDTGISLCRPLYYDYPHDKESYEFKEQYFFGDNLLIKPIAQPQKSDVSAVEIWLPKGNWINWFSGEKIAGGQKVNRNFSLDEYPVYVKEGAVVPTYPEVKNLKKNCDTIILKVFGKGNTESNLYEDDGDNEDYKTNQYANTTFKTAFQSKSQTLEISATAGTFKGMNALKTYCIDFKGLAMPTAIKVNGKIINKAAGLTDEAYWMYQEHEIAIRVALPRVKAEEKMLIEIAYEIAPDEVNGLPGKMKKAEKLLDHLRKISSIDLIPQSFFNLGQLALNIKYHPERFDDLVKKFLADFENSESAISGLNISQKDKEFLIAMLKA